MSEEVTTPCIVHLVKRPEKVTLRTVFLVSFLLLFLLFGFLASLQSSHHANETNVFLHTAHFALESHPLSGKEVEEVLSSASNYQDLPAFAFWGHKETAELLNPTLNRSTKASLIVAVGDLSLVVPKVAVPKLDNTQCVIDHQTALSLFGDSNVVGLTLNYDKTALAIADVVESARPFCIISFNETSGASFDRIAVQRDAQLSQSTLIGRFSAVMGHQLTYLDYSILYSLAISASWAPLLSACLCFLIILLAQSLRKQNSVRQRNIWLIVFWDSLILFGAFAAFNLELPKDLFPSRWSDASLWQQSFSAKVEAAQFLFDSYVPAPFAGLFDDAGAAVLFALLSLGCFLVSLLLARAWLSLPENTKKLEVK